MTHAIRTLAGCTIGMLFSAQVLAQEPAPRSKTTGLLLGVHLNGSAATYEDDDEMESGGGIGFTLGYGFNPRFTVFATADVASLDFADWEFEGTYSLAHFDLGARYNFAGPQKTLVPYLEGSLTGRAIASEITFYDGTRSYSGDLTASGSGATLGGGLQVYFSPALALDVGLKYSFGSYTEWEFEGDSFDVEDTGSTTTRFNVGLSWRPGK